MSRKIQGVHTILIGPVGQFQSVTKEVHTVQRGSQDTHATLAGQLFKILHTCSPSVFGHQTWNFIDLLVAFCKDTLYYSLVCQAHRTHCVRGYNIKQF